MKQYRHRIYFVISLIWSGVLIFWVNQRFVEKIQLMEASDFDLWIYLGLNLVIILYLGVSLLLFKKHSKQPLKTFLTQSFDVFEEDERALAYDAQIRYQNINMVYVVSIMTLVFLILNYMYTIKLLQAIVFVAIMLTLYKLINLIHLNKAYKNDHVSKQMNPFRYLIIATIVYLAVFQFPASMNNTVDGQITFRIEDTNSVSYSIPFDAKKIEGGYYKMDMHAYLRFQQDLEHVSASLFVGDKAAYDKERVSLAFYESLIPLEILFVDREGGSVYFKEISSQI